MKMRNRKWNFLRLLVLLVLLALTTSTVGCDDSVTYVGVSYGYPGWYGPCCWGGGPPGWSAGGVYMGGPVVN
jgi:hypothetical protein